MFKSIEALAQRRGAEEIYQQTFSAFSNRLVTAYNADGVAYRDIVQVQTLRRHLEALKKDGRLEGETVVFAQRNARPHEVFFNDENDFRMGLSLGGMMFAHHLRAIKPDFIDSFPDLVFASIQPYITSLIDHEKAHRSQFASLDNVTSCFSLSFDQNLLTGQPHFAAGVVPFGEVPYEIIPKLMNAPHDPSSTDKYVSENLSF